MPLLLDKAMPQLRRSLSLAQLTFYSVAPWSAAALSGIGGALFSLQVGFMSPSFVGIVPSIEMVIYAAVGGRMSLVGAVFGALLVNWGKTVFSESFPDLWLFLMAALFIGVTMAFPDGLAGVVEHKLKPWWRARQAQRKQIRARYAISNRLYTNAVMLTASTGLMPGGWAVSVSGSRRWAEEGWYDGTFFDGYSYFLSVDKKFGDKHSLNLTFLGAPSTRGRNGDTFQEMYDLAGTTRYNPNWGYWNGEKRNASVNHSHQPIALLRYDWTPSINTNLMATSVSYTPFTLFTDVTMAECNNAAFVPPTATAYSPVQATANR